MNTGDETFNYTIFPTYSPKAILAQPGLFDEALRELQHAYTIFDKTTVNNKLTEEELRASYRFPRTVEEVKILCDEIINYHNPGQDPNKHFIAVDTETSSLEMYDPASKILMISFAWATRKATAILLDHPKRWWTSKELKQVICHVRRVLECIKPKVFHNYKFDAQVLIHHCGWEVNNVVWDTLGAEHLLEEDKKGSYGLKSLTKTRLPLYAGYDDKVQGLREQHGGLTRAEEGKRFRKAMLHYEETYTEYADRLKVYNAEFIEYERKLTCWEELKNTEKERVAKAKKAKASKEECRLRKDVYGKKPSKPRKPNLPKEPQHQEPFDYTMIPLEDLELYAAIDADVTRQHVLHQQKRFMLEYAKDKKICACYKRPCPLPTQRLVSEHVIPTSKSLAQMEFTGFPVDLNYLEELDGKLKIVVQETAEELYELAGEQFIINNPAEIARIMFDSGFYQDGQKVTVPLDDNIRRTAKGKISSDEKALLYVANTYKHDFPKIILKHRKAQKARNPFLTNVREHALVDGKMHPTFWLQGTSTGRLSSSGENMQNQPKKLAGFNIKKIFVPPEGNVLINADAKGAEIRIFAAYSKDKKLITSINDGLDTHSFFTSEVFGPKYDEVEQARDLVDQYYAGNKSISLNILKRAEGLVRQRTNCKRVVFGTLYGALAKKIAETAGIPIEEAQEVIDLMFKMFPSIPAYIDSTQYEVQLFHWVATYTGRKRRFPMADIRMFRNRCYRQAVNFKIQSTASDIVLWVMNKIFPIVTNDLKGQFHATVHDSIVFSVPPKYLAQINDIMYEYGTKQVAKKFPWLPVAFLWDIEAGSNYGEVAAITKYLQGKEKHDNQQQKENIQQQHQEIISGEEIRQEINEFFAT
ncbi:MAG: DNA polymerase, partial [Desulfobacteraceae bacterium]|jgi:DNA polymerase I-like protein with 3'-5' exonuclease and polymerase domains